MNSNVARDLPAGPELEVSSGVDDTTAVEINDVFLSSAAKDPGRQLQVANQHLASGNENEAADWYRMVTKSGTFHQQVTAKRCLAFVKYLQGAFTYARAQFEELASEDLTASRNLAVMLIRGEGGDQNIERATELLRSNVKLGDKASEVALSKVVKALKLKARADESYEKSLALIEQASNHGDIESGILHIVFSEDDQKILGEKLEDAVSKGSYTASYFLSAYLADEGAPEQLTRAAALLKKSSEVYPQASYSLGLLLLEAGDVAPERKVPELDQFHELLFTDTKKALMPYLQEECGVGDVVPYAHELVANASNHLDSLVSGLEQNVSEPENSIDIYNDNSVAVNTTPNAEQKGKAYVPEEIQDLTARGTPRIRRKPGSIEGVEVKINARVPEELRDRFNDRVDAIPNTTKNAELIRAIEEYLENPSP